MGDTCRTKMAEKRKFEGLNRERGAVFPLEIGAQGDSISLKKSESHFSCNKHFRLENVSTRVKFRVSEGPKSQFQPF